MNRRPRGISMILALFTVAVLITLSITFLALAHNESRSSRSGYFQAASLQACNWALDYLINYMQAPPNLTGGSSMQFTSLTDRYFTLRIHDGAGMPGGMFRGYPVRVRQGTTAQRTIFFGDPFIPTRIPIGNELEAVVEMDFSTVTVDTTAIEGQPQRYTVSIRSRVYRQGDPLTSPLASRQVDVRLLEDSATRRKTNENDVSWDVQGNVPGARDELAMRVGIPEDYTETMPVRIVGHLGDPNLRQSWYDASGRIRYLFPPNAAGGAMFRQGVSIAQSTNLDRQGDEVDPATDAGLYSGGISRLAPRLGLPQASEPGEVFPYITKRAGNQVERGYGQYKASRRQGGNSLSGFIEIDSTAGAMRTGQVNPDGTISFGAAPVIDPSATDSDPLPAGVTLPPGEQTGKVEVRNAIEMDPRALSTNPAIKAQANNTPGIPNVVVTLGQGADNDRVSIQLEGKYSGQLFDIPGYQNVPISSFKEGVLYVKGGNVKVQTAPGAKVAGHLTIVAGEGTDREIVGVAANQTPLYDPATSIYHQAARDFFDARDQNGNLLNRGEAGPPYSAAQLGLNGFPADRMFYPPPKPGVEREGNLIVGSDLEYADSQPSVLGLVAQNFVMLNDRNFAAELPNPDMTVDAALLSFERSVQFDWDNTAGNPDFLSKRDVQRNLVGITGIPPDPGTPPEAITLKSGRQFAARDTRILNAKGKIQLRGSITSRFADVEGAYLQMTNTVGGQTYTANPHFGYTDQALIFYPYQTHVLPPNFPRYNLTRSQIPFTVENYIDRGAFSTEGTAP